MTEEKTERGRRRRRRSSRKGATARQPKNPDGTHRSGGDGLESGPAPEGGRKRRSRRSRRGPGGSPGGGNHKGGRPRVAKSSRGGRSSRAARPSSYRQGGRGHGPRGDARQRQRDEDLRRLFDELQRGTSIDPHERWTLERSDGSFTPRVIDLISPLGRGQRCLIVAPPKAGKTTLLIEVAESLHENHPDAMVYALLVDERPEEVTHFRRATHAQVIASSSDQLASTHVQVTEDALREVIEPVLAGKDVVLLLDSITRLARAYNTIKGDSGRTLSGGLDANTMQMPRRLFGAARKIEDGGSLTILGTALIDTGSRMDEVIFQEFKGTGNTEIVLSRQLFEKRIFPAVDIAKSGTRKEEKLYPAEWVEQVHKMRRVLATMDPGRAMEGLLKMMAKHPSNEELLAALP